MLVFYLVLSCSVIVVSSVVEEEEEEKNKYIRLLSSLSECSETQHIKQTATQDNTIQ